MEVIGNPTAKQVIQATRLIAMGLSATEVAERVRISFDDAIRLATEILCDREIADLEPLDLAE